MKKQERIEKVMEIINAHTHITKKAVKNKNIPKGNIKDLIRDMEKGKVNKSLILSTGNDYSIPELINIVKKDQRFSIIYSIDIDKDLKKQYNEIASLIKKGFVKGIKVLLGYFNIMPYDNRLLAFYDLCEKYDLPVVFHTGDTLWSNAKLRYSHPLNIDSLAVDRPNLKIVMAHIGNPWLIDAAEVIYKNPNVYGDISGFFLDFKDKKYISWMREKVNDFIAYTGGSKLLFGTDFPLADSINYIKFAESLDLSKEEQKLLFHGNAKKLFKLD